MLLVPAIAGADSANGGVRTTTPALQGRVLFTLAGRDLVGGFTRELYAANLDGTGLAPLHRGRTGRRYADQATASRSGLIAYSADDGVRLLDGGREHAILPCRADPTWAPDGRALACAGAAGILAVDIASRSARRVSTRGRQPAWSSHGDRIAFVDDDGVWVAPATGGPPGRVSGRQPKGALSWTPDGSRLVFVDDTGVVVLDLGSRKTRRLAADAVTEFGARSPVDNISSTPARGSGRARDTQMRTSSPATAAKRGASCRSTRREASEG